MTERIKTLLLAVLGAAAVLLTMLNWLSPALRPGIEEAAGPAYAEPVELSAAAKPMLLTQRSGEERTGAFYNGAELDAAMTALTQTLTEVLGSAGSPERIQKTDWLYALSRNGIGLYYAEPVPLMAVAAWYSADCAIETPVRHLLLTADDEGWVWLYFQDADGGLIRCQTASRAALPELELSTVCRYALEDEDVIGTPDGMTLLTGQRPYPALLRASAVDSQEALYPLLRALGIDPQTPFSSVGADGTVSYVDIRRQCMISPDGALYYSSPLTVAAGEDPVVLLETEPSWLGHIESCRRLLDTTAELLGDAEWTLLSAEQSHGRWQINFGLRVSAIPVRGGAYAGFIIESGRLTELHMQVRRYSLTHETRDLPMDMALALADGRRAYRLHMIYPDLGEALIAPVWAAE